MPTTIVNLSHYRIKKNQQLCNSKPGIPNETNDPPRGTRHLPLVNRTSANRGETDATSERHHEDFDRLLCSREVSARENFTADLQRLTFPRTPQWLINLLDNRMIPALKRIGFDASLVRVLFRMASPAWKLIGPITGKSLWFEPSVMRELDEVRQGLRLKAKRTHAIDSQTASATPQDLFRMVMRSADPSNLNWMFEEISTPWIILPRAYGSLRKHDCRYLPAYLDIIDKETDVECMNIFIRIVIEFIANYSLKFASAVNPPNELRQLVVNGYSAMYWKNLRSPPRGLEDIRVFEHYLNWLKLTSLRFGPISSQNQESLNTMVAMRAYIFPAGSKFQSEPDAQYYLSRFMTSLRHGCLGISSAVEFFTIAPLITKHAAILPHAPILFALKSFFQQIKHDFHEESKRTQYFIREFLFQLRTTYESIDRDSIKLDVEELKRIRILKLRVMAGIRELREIF